jgi:hypothetical protein
VQGQTLDKLEAAFAAVEKDLSGRVAELSAKSTPGTLSQEEQAEYEQIVRLNDLLSILKLQAEAYWATAEERVRLRRLLMQYKGGAPKASLYLIAARFRSPSRGRGAYPQAPRQRSASQSMPGHHR